LGKVLQKYSDLIEKEVVRLHKESMGAKRDDIGLEVIPSVVNNVLELIVSDGDFSDQVQEDSKSALNTLRNVESPEVRDDKIVSPADKMFHAETLKDADILLENESESKEEVLLLKGAMCQLMERFEAEEGQTNEREVLKDMLTQFYNDSSVSSLLEGRSVEYKKAIILSMYLEQAPETILESEIQEIDSMIQKILEEQLEGEYDQIFDGHIESKNTQASSIDSDSEYIGEYGQMSEASSLEEFEAFSNAVIDEELDAKELEFLTTIFKTHARELRKNLGSISEGELMSAQIQKFVQVDEAFNVLEGKSMNLCKAFIYQMVRTNLKVNHDIFTRIEEILEEVESLF